LACALRCNVEANTFDIATAAAPLLLTITLYPRLKSFKPLFSKVFLKKIFWTAKTNQTYYEKAWATPHSLKGTSKNHPFMLRQAQHERINN